MIIFENFGEIDPLAICTFGVSAKEKDNPIGFFGTGLKYALAILLRSGHRVTIQSGKDSHVFSLKEATIRNQPFNLVAMNDQPMGFTDAVGKTWKLWMAYRELYCNCTDESGSIFESDEIPEAVDGLTRIIVEGDDFAIEHKNRANFILEGEPILRLEDCEVHHGASKAIFYRGIAVHHFPRAEQSYFTYNFTRPIDLTEDRTAKYPSFIPMHLAASILGAKDDEFIREVLTVPNDYFEHHLDFKDNVWGKVTPTPQFLVSIETLARDRAARTNVSALMTYKQVKRKELVPDTTQLRGVERETLERAIAFCKSLGFDAEQYPLIVTDTLGAGVLGMAEGSRIYIARQAFMQGTKRVAGTLIEEVCHLKYGYDDESRAFQDFLIDRLVSLGEEIKGEPL